MTAGQCRDFVCPILTRDSRYHDVNSDPLLSLVGDCRAQPKAAADGRQAENPGLNGPMAAGQLSTTSLPRSNSGSATLRFTPIPLLWRHCVWPSRASLLADRNVVTQQPSRACTMVHQIGGDIPPLQLDPYWGPVMLTSKHAAR